MDFGYTLIIINLLWFMMLAFLVFMLVKFAMNDEKKRLKNEKMYLLRVNTESGKMQIKRYNGPLNLWDR